MQEITEFVTAIPLESLKAGLELVKGNPVSKRKGALAALSIASYGLGQFLPDDENDIPIFTAVRNITSFMPQPTQAEAEAAFHEVIASHQNDGTMQAGGAGRTALLTILKAVLPWLLTLLV